VQWRVVSGEIRRGVGGYTLRRDVKCAEVIDGQRVVRCPFWRYAGNRLKRKGLDVKKAEMEIAQGQKVGAGDQQTQTRIAQSSLFVKLFCGYHSNAAARR
jgi:hypothetical protein